MTPPTIALCLSGGGLRATLFHFGLVKALRAHDKGNLNALAAVREIYSVSGGSIAAAHLVRHWARYINPNPAAFLAVQDEMIRFAGNNVRDRVVRRWLLFRWTLRRRAWWLQRIYEGLVGSGDLGGCYSGNSATDPPKVHILATSFRTGELCSFSPTDFEVEPGRLGDRKEFAPGGHLKLAYAVAASSAFPPLFPPVALTYENLWRPKNAYFQNAIHLSDGGVYDNLGYEKFNCNQRNGAPAPGLLIVSNAGGAFDTSNDKTYSSILSRNVRASDILMRRVGDNTRIAAQGSKCVEIAIDTIVAGSPIQPATQQLLRLVRTDLDAFPRDLARMLIDHGYRVTAEALGKQGWVETIPPVWCVTGLTNEQQSDIAMNAADRTFMSWIKSFWLDWRDWTAPVLCLLALTAIAGMYYVVDKAGQTRKAESEKMIAEGIAKADRNRIEQSRKEFGARRQFVNAQAETLEALRRAVASGDVGAARRELATAIVASETAAGAPVTTAARTARPQAPVAIAPITPREASRIINEAPAYAAEPAVVTHPQQVYIQFAGVLTRAQITALNGALRAAGWRAQGPSGERTALAAGLNEVRYSGNNAAAAQALADAINATGVVRGRVSARRVSVIARNVLEVWISR